jgi:DNA-binding response OmpR family regulator
MRILYIDDDPEDIEIFQDAVNAVDPSIEYLSAKSANDALSHLHTTDTLPDYLVLDINMPGMDGKTCLQEVRKYRQFDDVNVVIYSTNGFQNDIDQIETLRAKFIRKATSFNDLCEMIRAMASKNNAADG